MKYFVSTAIALALLGAASSSLADPQSDKDAKAAAQAHDRAEAKDKQQMQDRDHMNARDRQNQTDRDNANARDRQNQLDRDHMNDRDRQNQLDRDHANARDLQAGADRDRASARDRQVAAAHPGMGFQSHGMRPNDRGRAVYNPGAYAPHFVAQQRFRYYGPGYPGGWYARSWGYGDFLPFGWFAPAFYLSFNDYGLMPPPVGCEWVRQGPDAVLVDIYTGQVLSVDSGVFY